MKGATEMKHPEFDRGGWTLPPNVTLESLAHAT